MGETLSKCFGWHDLAHQRDVRKLQKQNRETAEETQRRIEDIRLMREAAEASQEARGTAFSKLTTELTETRAEIAKLATHVAQTQSGEQNTIQHTQMMLFVSRQKALEQAVRRHSTALANQANIVLAIKQLETDENIGKFDRALWAASKRVINDKAEDDIDEKADTQSDVLGRLRTVIERQKQTDDEASELQALDESVLSEEVNRQFKLSLEAKLSGLLPAPTSTPKVAVATTTTSKPRPRVSAAQARDIQAVSGVARVLSPTPSAPPAPMTAAVKQQQHKDVDELS